MLNVVFLFFCAISAGIGTKVNFMTDYTQQVVFTSKDPSLIMTFDTAMGLHSVWLLRQAKTEVSDRNLLYAK